MGDDSCIEHSDTRGDCAVVDGTMETDAIGRDLKDEGEPSTVLLVVVFYKEENIICPEWLATKQTISFLPTAGRY